MNNKQTLRQIGILLFDDVELLDFAGPMQVFSSLAALYPELGVEVHSIGLSEHIEVSKTQLKITPQSTASSWTKPLDMLLIPGGIGTRTIVKSEEQLSTIRRLIALAEISSSVCTGSLVLAKLSLLTNKKATTHFAALELLTKFDPSIEVDRSSRYHDHGNIVVSEGVSAGIDMSLYLVAKYHGQEKADQVRKYIEYYPEELT